MAYTVEDIFELERTKDAVTFNGLYVMTLLNEHGFDHGDEEYELFQKDFGRFVDPSINYDAASVMRWLGY